MLRLRSRSRRRVDPRDHLHAEGCGGAAQPYPCGSARTRPARSAREFDGAWISTIHGFCNQPLRTYPSPSVSIHGSESSRTRGLWSYGARRSSARSRRSGPEIPSASGSSRRPRGRPSPDADGRVRDAPPAGRALVLELDQRPGPRMPSRRLRAEAELLAADESATETSVGTRARCSERHPVASREARRPVGVFATAVHAGGMFEQARKAAERRARRARCTRPRPLQELLERRGETAAISGASLDRLRGPPALRARPAQHNEEIRDR